MPHKEPGKIRNVAVIGHRGTGKTSLVEALLYESGTINTKTSVNDNATLGAAQTVTLGAYPAMKQGRDRRAIRGRNVSLEISGTGPWMVDRVIGKEL